MNVQKRPVGRPRLGKKKVMITLTPAGLAQLNEFAKKFGCTRSDCIETIIRSLK